MRTRFLLAALPVLLVGLTAACSSDETTPGVATAATTAGGSKPSAAVKTSAPSSAEWAAYDREMNEYAACMRGKGYPNVRYLGHDRRQEDELVGEPPEAKTEVVPAVVQCYTKFVKTDRPVLDPPLPPTKEELAFLRKLAACLRANGLPDYPDPDPNPANSDNDAEAVKWAVKLKDPKWAAVNKMCLKQSGATEPPPGSGQG